MTQTIFRFALCLSLFLPGAVLAQEDVTPAEELPETEARAVEPTAASAQPSAVAPGLRIASEIGGGVVGGLAIGLVTGYAMCGLGGMACLAGPLFGVLAGVGVGSPIGAWAGGRLVGSQGTFLATLVGGLMGATAGIALLLPAIWIPALTIPLMIGAAALPMVGAIVAHELSHRRSEQRVALAPFLLDGGGGLGVVGRF